MIRFPLRRRSLRDPQYHAQKGSARIAAGAGSQRPLNEPRDVADLARVLADARHAALYVTDHSGGYPFRDEDGETLTILAGHAGRTIAERWY